MSSAIRLSAALFLLLLVAPFARLSAQGDRCATETILEANLEADTAYARSFFAVQTAMREMASTSFRTSTEYTLPVVVHVLHHGEAVGVENNLSDAQIQGAIEPSMRISVAIMAVLTSTSSSSWPVGIRTEIPARESSGQRRGKHSRIRG